MESCKEFVRRIVIVRRIVRSLIEWRAVRSLLGELRSLIDLRAVSREL